MGKIITSLTAAQVAAIKKQLASLRSQQALLQKAEANLNTLINSGGWTQVYQSLSAAKNAYINLQNQIKQINSQIINLENQLKYGASWYHRLFTR